MSVRNLLRHDALFFEEYVEKPFTFRASSSSTTFTIIVRFYRIDDLVTIKIEKSDAFSSPSGVYYYYTSDEKIDDIFLPRNYQTIQKSIPIRTRVATNSYNPGNMFITTDKRLRLHAGYNGNFGSSTTTQLPSPTYASYLGI